LINDEFGIVAPIARADRPGETVEQRRAGVDAPSFRAVSPLLSIAAVLRHESRAQTKVT